MELLQTGEFERDVGKLDRGMKRQLGKAIEKISKNPNAGKPLKHLDSVFSERVSNFRLIYQFKDDGMLLVCFKNRDEVYGYLKK